MNPELRKELEDLTAVLLSWDVPLAAYTSLRVGGPVACLARPLDLAGLQALLRLLDRHHYPYFVLGRGTNLLAPDAPLRAVAVSLEAGFSRAERLDASGSVRAGCGLPLSRLLGFCLKESLGGLEFIAGIPGSVGGALRLNAGTPSGAMAQVCRSIRLLRATGESVWLSAAALRFSYRQLQLPPGAVMVEAELSLSPRPRRQIEQQTRAVLKKRQATQPWRLPSAGSVFKNPPGDFAGRLLEAAGLKGYRLGGAQISPRHANFIVNLGQATARDILELISLAQSRVSDKFGIQLELEIHLIGNRNSQEARAAGPKL